MCSVLAVEELSLWVLKQVIQSLDPSRWIPMASFGYTGKEFGLGAKLPGLNPSYAVAYQLCDLE